MSKSYIDCLREISSNELYEGLLGYGLFADKLPPVFTSKKFYAYCKEAESNNKEIGFEKCPKDYVRYDSCRNTHTTRRLGIPVPFTYYYLCMFLRNKWDDLLDYFELKTKCQTYKRSQIHIQKLSQKHTLFEMNHEYVDRDVNLEGEIYNLRTLSKYKVEADISSCFPSIYSHAFAWAIDGKQNAKKNKNITKISQKTFGDQIDYYSRSLKNNETNGVLIGPHTSNLLSEIILCAVDEKLVSKNYHYVRHIDDYCCYVKSESEANDFLLDLNSYLREFELSLNVKKTKITRLPNPNNTDWVARLLQFSIDPLVTEKGDRYFKFSRLKVFVDYVICLANDTNNLSVYSYAMKMVSSYKLGKKALVYYITSILHLVYQYPYLVHWVDEYLFERFNVSSDEIKRFCSSIYDVGIRSKVYEACDYSMYWGIKYKIKFSDKYALDSIESGDCMFMVMALIFARISQDPKSENELKKHALDLLDESTENMHLYWLFMYEALDKEDIIDENFKRLKKKGISFIRDEYLCQEKMIK